VHFGRIFEICVEKGSEFKKGDARRKHKGRTVFQGNMVKDQNRAAALFEDLGGKTGTGEQADANGRMGRPKPEGRGQERETTQQQPATASDSHSNSKQKRNSKAKQSPPRGGQKEGQKRKTRKNKTGARGRPEPDASEAKLTNERTSHVACAQASPKRPARL